MNGLRLRDPAVLVAFGGRKRSGKDAAAEVLERSHDFHRESFSVAIDLAAREMDPIITSRGPRLIRYTEYVDEVCRGDFTLAKEHPEVRRFLEQVGGFGRSIDPTVWLDRAEKRVVDTLSMGQSFALTGVRFPNELEMVHAHGGLAIWISRPGHEDTTSTAVTETSVGPDDFEVVLVNDGTLEDLAQLVEATYAEHFNRNQS